MSSVSRRAPLCFRLPSDLHTAVEDMAATAGITTSEWIRDALHRIVYNEPPGIEEGYMQGRALGFRTVSLALRDMWESLPTNVKDAMSALRGKD